MRTFLAAGALLTLSLFGFANAGLVYRTQCAKATGTVETKWTYEWDTFVPYLRPPKETGCDVHSAKRVLLSTAGVQTLEERTAADIARGWADETSDASLVYVSELYVLIAELRVQTQDQYGRERAAAVYETGTKLNDLTPPPSVAEDHEQMVGNVNQASEYLASASAALREAYAPATEPLGVYEGTFEELASRAAEQMREFATWAEHIRMKIFNGAMPAT